MARWAEVTPQRFTFDVKPHGLLSRHAAPLDSLPTGMRDRVETTDRGRIRLTDEVEATVAAAQLEAVAPLAQAGKVRSLLLPLTSGRCPSGSIPGRARRVAPAPAAPVGSGGG